jgi:hypothetical protein
MMNARRTIISHKGNILQLAVGLSPPRVRHARDDGGYYERLRHGLLGHYMIHVYQEELLVLILALYHL